MNQARHTNVIRIGGAFLIVLSLLLLIMAYQGLRFANYQSSGVTAQATVTDKYTARTRQVSGSTLYRSDFLLDITFSTGTQRAGGKFVTAEALADEKSVAALHPGDQVQVIYLPDEPQNKVVLQAALEAGTLDLDKSQLESYRQTGIPVEATVDEIDNAQHTLRVMFLTPLSGGNSGDLVAATLDVNKSVWDAVNEGEKLEVVYLPEDPESNVVAKRMLEEGSVNPYLLSGLALVALVSGVGLMWRFGRSKRQA